MLPLAEVRDTAPMTHRVFRPTACLYLRPLFTAGLRLLLIQAAQVGVENLGAWVPDWPDLMPGFIDLPWQPSGLWAWLDLAVACMAVASLTGAWIVRATTLLVIYPEWIVHRTGLVRRRGTTLHIGDAIAIDVEQGPAGLIFGYGTLTIETRGLSRIRCVDIAAPRDAVALIHRLKAGQAWRPETA